MERAVKGYFKMTILDYFPSLTLLHKGKLNLWMETQSAIILFTVNINYTGYQWLDLDFHSGDCTQMVHGDPYWIHWITSLFRITRKCSVQG